MTPNVPGSEGGPVSGYAPAIGNYLQVMIAQVAAAIPEPSSGVLLGLGLGAVAVAGRFRNRRVG